MDESTRIWLRVDDDDPDDRHLEALTLRLRAELLTLDVAVDRPRTGDAPPGAKAVDWAAVGTLLITLAGSPVLASIIDAVSAWLGDRRKRKVRLEIDGDALDLAGAATAEQRARADAWVRRHSTARPGLTGARHALIVANNDYQDAGLSRLRAPAHDAERLAAVLGDPRIGGFTVRTMLDQHAHAINEAVEDFFADRDADDLLLLHFSGHGVKDESGELYFAAAGTKLNRLGGTAVAADFVTRLMNRSRSRRIVLLLDCCYSGAFARGMVARAGTTLALDEQFGGTGRAVITASSAMEYAFEGQHLADTRDAGPSVFTSALVDGLDSGDADSDQDGYIGLDELYEYVYDRVRRVTPNQTPGKWVLDLQGDLRIARRARPVTVPAPLPPELTEAMAHPIAGMRSGAVDELARLLTGRHEGLALAARQALEHLTHDDSRLVAGKAAHALGPPKQVPAPAEPAPVPAPAEPAPVPAPAEPKAVPTPVLAERKPKAPEPPAAPVIRPPVTSARREDGWSAAARIVAAIGVLLLIYGGAFISRGGGNEMAPGPLLFDIVALWVLVAAALVLAVAPLGRRERAVARSIAFGLSAALLGLLVVTSDGDVLSHYSTALGFGSWASVLGVLGAAVAAMLDVLACGPRTATTVGCAALGAAALSVYLLMPESVTEIVDSTVGVAAWLAIGGLVVLVVVKAARQWQSGRGRAASVWSTGATVALVLDAVLLALDTDLHHGFVLIWPAVLLVVLADLLLGDLPIPLAVAKLTAVFGLLAHAPLYVESYGGRGDVIPHMLLQAVAAGAMLAALYAGQAAARVSASTRAGREASRAATGAPGSPARSRSGTPRQ